VTARGCFTTCTGTPNWSNISARSYVLSFSSAASFEGLTTEQQTKAGRALAWPNLFQHCVSPFELADPSKPGHRKILAIFLVDPTQDPIVSATDIPPQQADWAAAAFEEACQGPASVLGALPQELRDLVKDQFPETVMTRKEAEAYRLKLMKERTTSVKNHERDYVQRFNMCEH
jgi:hypothetical protein